MRFLISFMVMVFLMAPAYAGTYMTYTDGDKVFEGYVSAPLGVENTPLVLIIHQWKGLSENEKMRSDMLAELGYTAFAIDMYGKDIRPETNEAAGAEATKYKGDIAFARKRIASALTFARSLDGINPDKIIVMGYCFGGTMALEAARQGANILGAVSFHGGLASSMPAEKDTILAEVEVHHGAADPHVPAEQVDGFMREMEGAGIDFTVYAYKDAVHAFTQKEAGDDPSKGAAYNEPADIKSWARTVDFLKRKFSEAPKVIPQEVEQLKSL